MSAQAIRRERRVSIYGAPMTEKFHPGSGVLLLRWATPWGPSTKKR